MRIQSIDAIRGFAVLGILFMNMPYHMNLLIGYAPFDHAPISDSVITFAQFIFADGKFRTLFCILFGAGMAILYEHAIRQSLSVATFLKTRLNWLFIFGFAHAVFVFGGDILMLYALAGIILINYLHLDNKELFRKSRFFIVLGVVFTAVGFVITLLLGDSEPFIRGSESYIEMLSVWQDGYLSQMAVQSGIAFSMLVFSFLWILWFVTGLMGLGVWLYRTDFFSHGLSKTAYRRVAAAALLFTIICIALFAAFPEVDEETFSMLFGLYAIFISLLYADFLIKHADDDNRLFRALCYCGQVALTLYLLQSICMALFFRLFLPWAMPDFPQYITKADLLVFALFFTAVQIFLARIVVKHFDHGPFEFLWRRVYIKRYNQKVSDERHAKPTAVKHR